MSRKEEPRESSEVSCVLAKVGGSGSRTKEVDRHSPGDQGRRRHDRAASLEEWRRRPYGQGAGRGRDGRRLESAIQKRVGSILGVGEHGLCSKEGV